MAARLLSPVGLPSTVADSNRRRGQQYHHHHHQQQQQRPQQRRTKHGRVSINTATRGAQLGEEGEGVPPHSAENVVPGDDVVVDEREIASTLFLLMPGCML